jgi:O-antigen ligase
MEYRRAKNEWVNQGWNYRIFGSELFNSRLYFNTRRTFHTDYITILAGSGLLGISILIFHYISMIKTLWSKKQKYITELNQLQFAVGLALIISMILYGFSGLVQAIEPRGTILLFIGVLIGRPAYPLT